METTTPTPGQRPGYTPVAAIERNQQLAADRAIDDPAKLARAARIIRTALERGRISVEDLTTKKVG